MEELVTGWRRFIKRLYFKHLMVKTHHPLLIFNKSCVIILQLMNDVFLETPSFMWYRGDGFCVTELKLKYLLTIAGKPGLRGPFLRSLASIMLHLCDKSCFLQTFVEMKLRGNKRMSHKVVLILPSYLWFMKKIWHGYGYALFDKVWSNLHKRCCDCFRL